MTISSASSLLSVCRPPSDGVQEYCRASVSDAVQGKSVPQKRPTISPYPITYFLSARRIASLITSENLGGIFRREGDGSCPNVGRSGSAAARFRRHRKIPRLHRQSTEVLWVE